MGMWGKFKKARRWPSAPGTYDVQVYKPRLKPPGFGLAKPNKPHTSEKNRNVFSNFKFSLYGTVLASIFYY